jgi:ferredoxin-NADP reductase
MMSSQIVKVLHAEFITTDVRRFLIEKPASYHFLPGQATDLAINSPGLENELRPFTFTSLNESSYLEFIIKIYDRHDGITKRLATIGAGDELIIYEAFGTISYKGPGLFLAGGAGITPFIAIFRQLKLTGSPDENILLFANRAETDIILPEELRELLGENYVDVIERPIAKEASGRLIDLGLLRNYADEKKYYYICGPEAFTKAMVEMLHSLGAKSNRIVLEA